MSLIPLSEAKAFLDVIHDADDMKLQLLLDSAEREALDFMNRVRFDFECPPCESESESESESEPPEEMPPPVRTAVLFLLQRNYQANPDDGMKLRAAAEVLLMPYRCQLGV